MPSTEPLGQDFRRLWAAFAVSAWGSALGFGALPLIAVLVLDVSTSQVSLLAALSTVAGAAIALPFGAAIEQRRKRPVMIAADLVRFVALASVPAAAALQLLTYVQLCVVGVVQAAATIAFTSASGAHLKALVDPAGRAEANSRFESTTWITLSIGPPLGGGLISLVGATVTLAIDAVSFLLSALGVRRIRGPEPVPEQASKKVDLTSGWRYIFGHRGLRSLFWNSQLFGGPIMMVSPLLAVLMLRELGMTPWQYGVALGAPCLGAVLGARLAPLLTGRFGLHRVLIAFGVLRTPWLLLLPFAPPGIAGMVLIVLAETGLMLVVGVFNPSFATYRMEATEDGFMSRVYTSWSISSRCGQPLFIAVGGVLAGLTSLRTAMLVGGFCCLASALILPWRVDTKSVPLPEPV
ncbi:MAG TPA: MFS transporter [Kribbella sp.]